MMMEALTALICSNVGTVYSQCPRFDKYNVIEYVYIISITLSTTKNETQHYFVGDKFKNGVRHTRRSFLIAVVGCMV